MSTEFSILEVSKRFTTSNQGRTRMRIWISETTNGIPPEVFMFQRIPAVPGYNAGEPEDRYVHVCSYADMVAFPKDTPSIDSPYYRKRYIDLAHDSRVFLEELWQQIKCQLQNLLEDIVRINHLHAARLVECPCEGSSCPSSSPSLSSSSLGSSG
jgi:hypothetical protein